MHRKATHANSWYTGHGGQLDKELTTWLGRVPEESPEGVKVPVKGARAVIAPHAGYTYSGQAAAYAYKCIDVETIKRVFILGPSHHVYLSGCAVSKCDTYETPLGSLSVDKEVCEALVETGKFTTMSRSVDEDEHSLEMHLPYIYKTFESKVDQITLVPILVGALTASKEQAYGRLLQDYLADPENFFVISSDFCHWGSRFSYTFYSTAEKPSTAPSDVTRTRERSIPIYESIERLDREGMAVIEEVNHERFVEYLGRTKNTICGRHPIGVVLAAIEGWPQPTPEPTILDGNHASTGPIIRFIHYSQSSRVQRPNESSVSYASAYIFLPVPA
ncbi:UPF0103-domain-containing protein [Basidiobolus meristosporus CBS 931.73]|uniref:UPF0103-domain-containing protein n=1 Tax=Basidiobolus meristosporus CBS 931.73 TaxID=1314790 RepID=A0A1Y1YZY7_9FUNG|nr:UPF0103-domain-containing protein [Basidiobolus meristosporus CBS 931.73]|eukprot:ORY03602.1 UPF0103-domain-containing protein [Basidiobolus meristosporus CBS 931.73]